MIVNDSSSQLGELGLSLKPPKWLRNAAKVVTGSKVNVSVPTGAGPVNVDVTKPGLVQSIAEKLRNAKVTITTGSPNPDQPGGMTEYVEQKLPGGWLTVGAGAVALLLVMNLARGRR
jgi:hypothetical protein